MTSTPDPLGGLDAPEQSRFLGYLVSEIIPLQDWPKRKRTRYQKAIQNYAKKTMPDDVRVWAFGYRPRYDEWLLRGPSRP